MKAITSLLLLTCLLTLPVRADDPAKKPVDVLRLSTAKVSRTSATGRARGALSRLFDNNVKTSAAFPTNPAAPMDVVFLFSKTVTINEVTVTRPRAKVGRDDLVRVEVLTSSLSAHAGFRSLRVCTLKPTTKPQRFSFVATPARWVMLRVTQYGKQKQTILADIALLGHSGAPKTNYAFNESPAKALAVLSQLKKLVKISVTPEEAKLFADARDGRLDDVSFGEAALMASGVRDAKLRRAYLQRLDLYTTHARRATSSARTPFAKGEKLLDYLHKTALKNGYVSGQTNLSTVLSKNTYNCVSSATLYNVIGRRLGLDARAIEVPDHAFSILYHGSRHVDVEVTTPGGFNPARDPEVLKRFTARTGKHYIADSHANKRREIGETGLVAVIYYNNGVTHSKKKEYSKALVRYFCALSLDPEFSSAVKNSLSTLASWSVALSKEKKYASALSVVNAGLQLAPKDKLLLRNRVAIWHTRISEAVDAGDSTNALQLVRQARKQVPGKEFDSMESWVFLRPAEKLAKKAEWSQALTVARKGIKLVRESARQEINDWQRGVYLRWSSANIDAKKYLPALQALKAGLKRFPKDNKMLNNVGFAAQEWARELRRKKQADKATAMLGVLKKSFPAAKLDSVAATHVGLHIESLMKAGSHADALKSLEEAKALIADGKRLTSLTRSLYDDWATRLAKSKRFREATATYDKGLSRLPNDPHLTHNATVVWQNWASIHIAKKDWAKAIAVYQSAVKQFPKASLLRNNLAYCQQMLKRSRP